MSSSSILCDRDTNIPLAPASSLEKEKPQSMEYHRQNLQSRLRNGQEPQAYISPSDGIMSPATQKLNAFKSKHAMKAKPQTLFAKASLRKIEASRGSDELMFADIGLANPESNSGKRET